MLKYTLGALAAAVILLGTAFVVIAQVTDGGANQGPAPQVMVSVWDDGVWPPDITIAKGTITELFLRNESTVVRTARLEGEGVEQLPELSLHEVRFPESLPYVMIEAAPGRGGASYVRFDETGTYELNIFTPGVFLSAHTIIVNVK
jgi:hypothetical protein